MMTTEELSQAIQAEQEWITRLYSHTCRTLFRTWSSGGKWKVVVDARCYPDSPLPSQTFADFKDKTFYLRVGCSRYPTALAASLIHLMAHAITQEYWLEDHGWAWRLILRGFIHDTHEHPLMQKWLRYNLRTAEVMKARAREAWRYAHYLPSCPEDAAVIKASVSLKHELRRLLKEKDELARERER